MKKNTTKIFIAAIFLTISGTAYAQEGRVGINTSTPAATLDVVASPSNATRIDGFIAPRLKGSELKAKDALYTTAQEGAIVYVTEAVSGVTDKTTNVTSIGYYYFDKTQGTAGRWMKIANPSAAGIYQEPWNNVADGTPATTNTQNLYQTGDIGIRTNSPKATLDVQANDTGRPFGIIAPRVTAVQLRNAGGNFNADQDAALVYVTQEFGSSDTPTDRTSNVTSIGYYYFDKTQGTNGRWMKIANPTTITYQEPWVVQGGTTPATTNSQAISQNASVAIGKSTAYNSTIQTMLDVAGAVRGGTGQSGVVGINSAAFGNGAKATGAESFATGNNTTASGAQSFAGGGNGAVASGQYAFAFGNGAQAFGNHAVAMGVGTVAPARSGATFGRYNVNTFTSADISQNQPGDPIFQIGAGADDGRRFNILTTFLGTNGTTGSGGGWLAVGGDINTMPTRINNETLRVYGGTLSNSAYVTDINGVAGANTDKLVVADATTGQLKTISATGSAVAYQEPWVVQGSTTPATTNSQAISQNASVAIGKSSAYSSTNTTMLDVVGAIRSGSSQSGVVGSNSVAFGQSNTASNWQSTAIGDSNTSSGVSSVALGSKNKATGDASLATGNTTTASGVNATAIGGTLNKASGTNSFASGYNNQSANNQSFTGGANNINNGESTIVYGGSNTATSAAVNAAAFGAFNTISGESTFIGGGSGNNASANYSVVLGGINNTASGSNAIVFAGDTSTASGKNSIAAGNSASATGDNSLAFGNNATASFTHSIAIGIGTATAARSGVSLGRFNRYTTGSNTAANAPGDVIFQVGQGTTYTNRVNLITGYYGMNTDNSFGNGWVVIGANPSNSESVRLGTEALTVYGKIASTGAINAGGSVNGSVSTYPDYVFQNYYTGNSTLNSNYKFTNLYETEKFIKENHHLPGVTSINELEKTENGYSINIGATATQALEKAEELYLHTIEQQKQIDELKDIVKQQQKQIDQLLKK